MKAQSLRSRRHELRGPLLLGSILISMGLAACSAKVLPGATLWSANLRQQGPDGIQGTLAAVSQAGGTQASMQITSGQSGATYLWRMAKGDCTTEGTLVGGRAAYPPLVPNDQGSDSQNAVLAGEMTPGGSYAARILQDSAGTEQVLACAALQQTN